MQYLKVKAVSVIDNYILLVEFDNSEKKKYDVSPLLSRRMFAPLKDLALFKAVTIEPGGYAVVWNSDIDISEYELWSHGQAMS